MYTVHLSLLSVFFFSLEAANTAVENVISQQLQGSGSRKRTKCSISCVSRAILGK